MTISKNKKTKKNRIQSFKKVTKKVTNKGIKINKINKKTKKTKYVKSGGGNDYNINCRIENFDYGNIKKQKYTKGIRNIRECEYVEEKIIKHLYGKNFVGIPVIEQIIHDIKNETYKDLPNGTKYKYDKLTRYERLKHLIFKSIENNEEIPDDIKERVKNKFYSGLSGMFRRLFRSNKESEMYESDENENIQEKEKKMENEN
jgi:hypothetical protein